MFRMEKSNDAGHQDLTNNQKPSDTNVPDPTAKKKVRSEKQREASRRNGSLSPGPRNTERTRYNALKYGARAAGLTPMDDVQEYQRIIAILASLYPSADPFTRVLIDQSAKNILRLSRIDRMEADNLSAIAPDAVSDPSSDSAPAIHFMTMKEWAGPLFDLPLRYRTSTLNSLLRCKRELERIPRDEPDSKSTEHSKQGDAVDLASLEPPSELPT